MTAVFTGRDVEAVACTSVDRFATELAEEPFLPRKWFLPR
jgi:hypothetical protein